MKKYYLIPNDSHKSFYGKAIVIEKDNGEKELISYATTVMKQTKTGEYIRLWDGWTATTGRHIKAFSGLNKAEYFKLATA